MAHQPDGMGADRYYERENMRHANADPGFTHDVVAVDSDGNVLYETECLYPNEVNGALAAYDATEIDGVDHFEIRER